MACGPWHRASTRLPRGRGRGELRGLRWRDGGVPSFINPICFVISFKTPFGSLFRFDSIRGTSVVAAWVTPNERFQEFRRRASRNRKLIKARFVQEYISR